MPVEREITSSPMPTEYEAGRSDSLALIRPLLINIFKTPSSRLRLRRAHAVCRISNLPINQMPAHPKHRCLAIGRRTVIPDIPYRYLANIIGRSSATCSTIGSEDSVTTGRNLKKQGSLKRLRHSLLNTAPLHQARCFNCHYQDSALTQPAADIDLALLHCQCRPLSNLYHYNCIITLGSATAMLIMFRYAQNILPHHSRVRYAAGFIRHLVMIAGNAEGKLRATPRSWPVE